MWLRCEPAMHGGGCRGGCCGGGGGGGGGGAGGGGGGGGGGGRGGGAAFCGDLENTQCVLHVLYSIPHSCFGLAVRRCPL